MAVAPAPATTSTVTTGPSWVMVPKAVPAPDRSAAPISRSRMLRVKATSTVNGIATSSVGNQRYARDHPRLVEELAELKRPPEDLANVSRDISTNPPTARAGTASCSINLGSVLGAGVCKFASDAASRCGAVLALLHPAAALREPDHI